MKIHYFIYIFFIFISCGKETKKENSTPNLKTKTETSKTIKNSNEREKVEFVKHQTYGIILNQNNRLFDENLKEIGSIYSLGFEKVQILEITKKMYNLENSSDNCEKAYFVKIKYNGKDCIIFGKEIFEINNKQLFRFQNTKGDEFSIFPVTNFEMGASNDDELTGCDDYSVLIIANEKENTFHPIKLNANKNAELLHDNSAEEQIYKVSIEKDTLIVGIKTFYQEGGSIFNLETTFKNNFTKSIFKDKKTFEEDDIEKLKQIK
nr:hypothetical protein [uncultured Flavobacterium sp.]